MLGACPSDRSAHGFALAVDVGPGVQRFDLAQPLQ
jgi:hypothetical protein